MSSTLSRRRLTIRKTVVKVVNNENSGTHKAVNNDDIIAYKEALRCIVYPIISAVSSSHKPLPPQPGNSFGNVHKNSINESRSESVLHSDSVLLADKAIELFKERLEKRAKILGMIDKDKERVFSGAGTNLLKTFGKQTAPFANLKDLILLIGTSIRTMITNTLSLKLKDEEFDDLVIQVTNLFMSIIRMAVSDAPNSGNIRNWDILNKKEAWIVHLRSILRSNVAEPTDPSSLKYSSLASNLRYIFGVSKEDHDLAVMEARKFGKDTIAFAELTNYIGEINSNKCKFSYPSDFESVEGYEIWKKNESQTIQMLIKTMIAREGKPPQSTGSINTQSLIPKQTHHVYSTLLSKCLVHDRNHDHNGRVVELSKASQQILSECALRWHLGKVFREIALLDQLVQQFGLHAVTLSDIYPIFKRVQKTCSEMHLLRKNDLIYYLTTIKGLKNAIHKYIVRFSSDLSRSPETAAHVDSNMQLCVKILSRIVSSPVWGRQKSPQSLKKLDEQINEELLEAIVRRFTRLNRNIDHPSLRPMQKLILLAKAINQEINKYGLFFPTIVNVEGVDTPTMNIRLVAAETCLKYLILELNNMSYVLKDEDYAIKETLDLYQVVRQLYDICEESKLEISKTFEVEAWFHPFIFKYLDLADQKCLEWVKPAVEVDKFEPILPPMNMFSSSVLDIFTSFHHALDFIEKFNWKELGKKEALAQNFIRTLSKSLKEYAALMFAEFRVIMDEDSSDSLDFTRESCVKLNNLLSADLKLTEILEKLGVSTSETRFDPRSKRTEPLPGETRFNVTVVRASDLMAADWSTSDPYVILKYKGIELKRTSVKPKNLSPVWNEQFTINLPHSVPSNEAFLDLEVYDEDYLKSDDLIGTASVFMRDRLYEDFLTHDVAIDLKPQGVLYIRIVKEGEIEDSGWHVRNAQEKIRQTIQDMVEIYVAQLTRYYKASIESLFPSASFATTAANFFSSLFSKGHQGAAVESTVKSNEKIEAALHPVFEYMDKQFSLFNENLDSVLGDFLMQQNPWLKAAMDLAASTSVVTLKRVNTHDDEAMIKKTEILEEPNFIIKMVWHECLKALGIHLLSFGTINDRNGVDITITATEKVQIGVIETVMEMTKSLFHCGGKALGGFDISELEGIRYREVRQSLRNFGKAAIQ